MKTFFLEKQSEISRDVIFKISTDILNFNKILPNYFQSLVIIKENKSEKIVEEQISFLRKNSKIRTKHVILPPDIHKIFILSGPLQGTIFTEKYTILQNGTCVKIKVNLKLNGLLRFIPLIDFFIFRKMKSVMNEFLHSAEVHASPSFSN